MQTNGAIRQRIATFPFEAGICFTVWSPGGKRISYTSHRVGNYEIYVMNADGSRQKRITHTGGTSYGAAWSPDGKRMAYTSMESGAEEVYVMNANGSEQKRLTATSYYEHNAISGRELPRAFNRNPAWSADGKQIALASERSSTLQIYTMNADGTEPRQLTDFEGDKDEPSWSPDGNRIVFRGIAGLWMIDTSGKNLQLLTSGGLLDSSPSWSPDGRYIVYTSHVDTDFQTRPVKFGHAEIFIMEVTSKESIRLTTTQTNNQYPSWIR